MPKKKPATKLPPPFSAEELTDSYQSIPAADLAPMPIPTERPLDAMLEAPDRRDTTGNPGTPREGSGTLRDTPQATSTSTTKFTETDNEKLTGDVAAAVADSPAAYGDSAANLPRETQADATRRWRRTGIAEQVAAYRDRKREEYSRANPKTKRRDAHEYAWTCAMAEFPPPGVEPQIAEELLEEPPQPEPIALDLSPIGDELEDEDEIPQSDDGVPGLGELPASWGTLPANASLQVEISWVSANRLRVRSGTGVDLSRALSPAPSYSALSWLETSILFPSKFADISVKATAQQDDEREGIRREKLAIEEIRGLLAEMLEG